MSDKVTALRVQQRRKDRVNVFLDGAYAFSLQLILAAELRVGQELSKSEIDALQRRDAGEKAYESALHFLSFRPRSKWEIEQHLRKKKVGAEAIEAALARLEQAKLVNDLDFARFWVENRETFRPRGAWALRAELLQKGIARETIDTVLEGLDEENSAMNAAERKAQQLAHLDKQTFRRRLSGFLQRRGFGYGICSQVTDHYWRQVEEARPTEQDERAWPDDV